MIKEAIVLAGGFGTRLQSVVSNLPKPMAPIGDKPFLAFVLDYLQKYGVEHVVLSTGYRNETISDFFGNRYKNMHLTYAIENEPLGTGGAIKYAMSFLNTDGAFVVNGDTLFDVDLKDFYVKSTENQADLSLALRKVEEVSRYGSVEIDDRSRIVSFLEKGKVSGQGIINGGIYFIPNGFFEKISNLADKFSMEKDIFEVYFQTFRLVGIAYDNYFIDIGIPEDYERAIFELNQYYHE